MSNFIGHRIILFLLGVTATSCSGELTLPSDGSRPAQLLVVSGDDQEATVRSRLDPLVVRVVDARSQPMEGVEVVFEFESATPDATVSPSQAATTSEGLASAEVQLGTDAGAHIVEAYVAQASGSGLRATFDLNALERGKGKGKKGGEKDDDDDDDDDDD